MSGSCSVRSLDFALDIEMEDAAVAVAASGTAAARDGTAVEMRRRWRRELKDDIVRVFGRRKMRKTFAWV